MSVTLDKALIDTKGLTKKEKLRVMKARQSALCLITLGMLEKMGYERGTSLKIPGAFAFNATCSGKLTKIGLKTSADRWVGVPRDGSGNWGLLSAVDEVFVVTFDDRYVQTRMQVLAFDPKVLITMGEKVYAAAKKSGQTGIQWIPIDKHEGRSGTSMTAGHLLPHGKMIIDEPIEWTSEGDNPDTSDVSVPDAVEDDEEPKATTTPIKLTISQAKAGLAANFGVSEDAIKITIEG
jgi:hypothetical protein